MLLFVRRLMKAAELCQYTSCHLANCSLVVFVSRVLVGEALLTFSTNF